MGNRRAILLLFLIFELSSPAVTQEKLFSPCSEADQQSAALWEMFLLFFFSFPDSGPSNQLHLRSGGGASSLTHPNSYLPVQLMAYLLLPWLGRKS